MRTTAPGWGQPGSTVLNMATTDCDGCARHEGCRCRCRLLQENRREGSCMCARHIKGQKKDDAANTNGKPAAKKLSAGELRLHKDIAELNLPKTTKITFPNDKDDLMNFETTIKPDEGYYVVVKPHGSMVYHPNIDLEGNVCLNILREYRKPVLNINTIVYELNLLFSNFERNVRRAMAGGYVGETHFPRSVKIGRGRLIIPSDDLGEGLEVSIISSREGWGSENLMVTSQCL
ncbi:LOW QUALITY PROTEIN: hypothetical protein U9M48_041314 [Paspalum notatum var. saurae]|uniref:UBC core domain-containing protein n=1 Tax=Paspalum notatum var. saurae TaxID=547442 RepID=A0AAQ3UN03_PASNO